MWFLSPNPSIFNEGDPTAGPTPDPAGDPLTILNLFFDCNWWICLDGSLLLFVNIILLKFPVYNVFNVDGIAIVILLLLFLLTPS